MSFTRLDVWIVNVVEGFADLETRSEYHQKMYAARFTRNWKLAVEYVVDLRLVGL